MIPHSLSNISPAARSRLAIAATSPFKSQPMYSCQNQPICDNNVALAMTSLSVADPAFEPAPT